MVVRDANGDITTYNKKGVRDLEDLLEHNPDRLRGADIADKVIGKAAAGMAVYGGVKRIFAEVMSRKAVPMLENAGVEFSSTSMVDCITIAEGDVRCTLEKIVAECKTPEEVVSTLRSHFEEMKLKKQIK